MPLLNKNERGRIMAGDMYFLVVLLIEGAALMAVELMGAKFLAPFYGSSLYVWTAVLGLTVLGLTSGYYFGGWLSQRHPSAKLLVLVLAVSALLVFLMPYTTHGVIALTDHMNLIAGICLAGMLLLVPPTFCFGIVGPMVVRLMADRLETVGHVAGTVYFTSTLGGIAATFLFGFYMIPEMGLGFSSLVTASGLLLLPLIYFSIRLVNQNSKFQIPKFENSNSEQIPDINLQKSEQTGLQSTLNTQHSSLKAQNSIYWFAALEGASVIAVELLSARMLAPYFGSTLYVWGAVIGITLLSLALGYFIGGRLADRYMRLNVIHWVLLFAAAFIILMHIISLELTLALGKLPFVPAVVMVSLFLLLPPLLFLGMVPTLIIRYLTANVDNAGAITGRVFTVSSVSGILALPLMGFLVIPAFGLTRPSILIGLIVALAPMIQLLRQKKYIVLLFLPIIIFSFSQSKNPKINKSPNPPISQSPNLRVLHYSEGLLGQVFVADVIIDERGQEANDRMLFVNRMGQTNVDSRTGATEWNYITFSTALASRLPEGSRALVLGLGGGSAANNFCNMKFRVDAVELDQRIARVARKYFSLNPEVQVIVDDARHYLETTDQKYDLIFFDLFKGEVQPAHVMSLECFEKAKSLLKDSGMIIINFNGFLTGAIGKPGRSVYKTLEAAGLETELLPTPGEEKYRNCLFVAGEVKLDFSHLSSPLLFKGEPVAIDSLFVDAGTLDLEDAVVFTDDRPILEKLNIPAGNTWRRAYNESYMKYFMDNGVRLFR